MSYVRKMGASALVVATAFAVAFAVLLSTPDTAEAELRSRATDGTFSARADNDAENGDTIYVRFNNDGYATFTISTTGAASASFVHSDAADDGQSIVCGSIAADATGAATSCDREAGDSQVTVEVKIDDDSGKGVVFVKQEAITGAGTTTTDAIDVTVAQVPTSLTVKANTNSIDAKGDSATPATAGRTYVDIRLLDENNKGIAGESITVVSTRALLQSVAAADGTHAATNERAVTVGALTETVTLTDLTGSGSLAGTVTSTTDAGTNDVDTAGYARVVVIGAGSPGISTITVTMGELSATADIVLHGPVKTLSAELEQGAIEVGGMTHIVVTALDAGGNPVANQNVAVKTQGGVTPPERLAVPVGTSNTVNKDSGTIGSLRDKGDLPACGDVTAVTAAPDADPPVVGVAGSTGTNGDGKCVIQVTAPDNAGTATDAARGTHTVTLVASNDGSAGPRGVNEPSVEVQVGGPAAAIASDAPARIDPSTELTVNLTVTDDENVRVGRVAIEVQQTAGDGAIITPIGEMTSDGRAKFTYLAASRAGVVEFLVRTRDADNKVMASLPIIIDVGAEEEEAPPEAPSLSRAPSSTGFTLVTFSGGSVDDLSTALTDACGDGVRAWATDYQGNYVSFFPSAPAVVNSGFNSLFSDGVPAGEPLLVGNCGG